MELSRSEWLKSEWGLALLTVSVLLVILFGLVWAWTGIVVALVMVVLQLVTLWGLHDQWDGFIRRTWANTEEAKERHAGKEQMTDPP